MANKTRLKHMGRRGLSFFLALVMCISLVQITAFAEGETPAEEQARLQMMLQFRYKLLLRVLVER